MRLIHVSTDVFAALWARRQPGEDNENMILERLLGLPRGTETMPPQQVLMMQARGAAQNMPPADGGIHNLTFDVRFPAGFEIFRTYKGKHYSAVVRDNRWFMNGMAFPSLFALSMAIVDSRENPWMHWRYRDSEGKVRLIRDLRPKLHDGPGDGDAGKPARRTRKAARKN